MKNRDVDMVYGIRAVMEAINSGKEIDRIMVKRGLTGELFGELMELLKENGIRAQVVPEVQFAKFGRKNHQGVVAMLSPVSFVPLEELVTQIWERGESPFLVVLDGITDVRNFGAIVRTAECAGAHGIVVPSRGAARISSDAVKTSAGALMHMPICKVPNLYSAINYLKLSGVRVVAATEKTENCYTKANLKPPLAIVMGSEEKGIETSNLKLIPEQVSIPLHGNVKSLNVSVAAGLLLYEAIRG